jgi:hypothetical protein
MKGITLFLSLIAILAAGVSGMLYVMAGNEKENLAHDLDVSNTQLAEARLRIGELLAERGEHSNRNKSAETELNELKARNTTLEARNSQLSREMSQLRDQLGSRATTDQAAARQITELNRQLLEAQAAATTATGAATAEQVAKYQARITDLEKEVASLRRGGGSTGPALDPLANVPANLTANVIDVGPRAAFVVLDIGTRNGAAPSLEMVLRRGSVVIAHVRLTEVKETYSVAHVLPRTGNGNVRPGDTASRS